MTTQDFRSVLSDSFYSAGIGIGSAKAAKARSCASQSLACGWPTDLLKLAVTGRSVSLRWCVWPALDGAMDSHPGASVAVVTHDALIRPILTTVDPRIGPIEARTGSWNELVRQGSSWTVLKHDQNPETVRR